jgi:hypothetical protein
MNGSIRSKENSKEYRQVDIRNNHSLRAEMDDKKETFRVEIQTLF